MKYAQPTAGQHIAIVFLKEILDALRDRRTLLRMVLPGLLIGPLMLSMLSGLVAQFEARAEKREVLVQGMAHGPTLINFIERQNYTVKPAPADYEKQLRDEKLGDPVLVIPETFEAELARGDQPSVEVVTDSANTRAAVGGGAVAGLVRGFNGERGNLALMVRGVSPQLTQPVELTERDLATPGARAVRLTSMIPMFVIMAVLYGCLTAALDTTSGERERTSLEPLLTNPVQPLGLVVGKWGAVALMGAGIAALSSLSFIPAQMLLKSDALAAQFRFGWTDAAQFAALLLPIAGSMAALLMAVAIRTKTYKEASAAASLVITVFSLLPMVSIMNPGGDAPWYHWVPGLGQYQQMMLVLKGEAVSATKWGAAVVSGLALTALSLGYVAQQMRAAAAR